MGFQEKRLSWKYTVRWGFTQSGKPVVLLYERSWRSLLDSIGSFIFRGAWKVPARVVDRAYYRARGTRPVILSVHVLTDRPDME